MNEQRDRTFSILKALAILLVVTAHAAAPTYVSRFAYMVSVPAFFVCAGYFFRPDSSSARAPLWCGECDVSTFRS